MFASGLIGFLAGVVFDEKKRNHAVWQMSLFGFLVTLLIYGGILNFYATLSYTNTLTKEMMLATYLEGFPLDMIHAISTALFLSLFGKQVLIRLEHMKTKYGLME